MNGGQYEERKKQKQAKENKKQAERQQQAFWIFRRPKASISFFSR
jgi:hypothetical protein